VKKQTQNFRKLKLLPKILSRKELTLTKILIIIIVISFLTLVLNWYLKNSHLVPADGGEYIEGIVGEPRFLNPVLLQDNEVDLDLTRLLFNGLFGYKDNKLTYDLARRYSISSDQKTYTFYLRRDVFWHDGVKFTADDVVFTIESIQNTEFRSPLYLNFLGLKVSKINDYTVKLELKTPYSPFPSLLTFGILPKHIWEEIPSASSYLADFNFKTPIGTGPFQIKSYKKDSRGVLKSYTFIRNEKFYKKNPYLKAVTVKFYPDTESALSALESKNIDGLSSLPSRYHDELKNQEVQIKPLLLPQYTAVFFNDEKKTLFKSIKVKKALALSLDRQRLMKQVLQNQGTIINGPILEGFLGYSRELKKHNFDLKAAAQLLIEDGWQKDMEKEGAKWAKNVQKDSQDSQKEILEFTLTTIDNPETIAVTSFIKKQWEAFGVTINLVAVKNNTFLNEVIKPRNYEVLLVGQSIGSDPDPYPFWHSSQTIDDGLNLAMYKNIKVDGLLEEARKISNLEERAKKYIEFQNILVEDLPAIFLYRPAYFYLLNKKIRGFEAVYVSSPADRFNNIEGWYIKMQRKF
jgi:peptide/nickel transport system substrate-binding protein